MNIEQQLELGKFGNENKKHSTKSKLIVSKHSLRRADRPWAKNLKSMRRLKKKRYSQPAPHDKSYLAPPNALKNEYATFPGRQALVCLKVSLPKSKKTY